MILTKKQQKKFEALAKPMMKFLCKNFHPHVTVIIEPTSAEILSGSASIVTHKFVRD